MRLAIAIAIAIALTTALAGAASAQDCPPAPDIAARADPLHEALRGAPDPAAAARLSAELWRLWTRAPGSAAQALLDRGMGAIRAGDLIEAERALGRLVEVCPDYAEGWNQRAFARFLGGRFDPALEDLDRALALSPRHLGVLSGRAMTLMGLGRTAEAQETIRGALRLNPWLAERAILPEAERNAVDL